MALHIIKMQTFIGKVILSKLNSKQIKRYKCAVKLKIYYISFSTLIATSFNVIAYLNFGKYNNIISAKVIIPQMFVEKNLCNISSNLVIK